MMQKGMALRETRAKQRANAGESCSADSMLRSIQDPTDNVAGLSSQLKLYLAPLAAVASGNGPGGKENRRQAEEHSLVKQHLPFLVELLKVCSGLLAAGEAKLGSNVHKKADELFSAMALGLDSLQQLRAWLAGCSHEIEIQRYRLVRLLITWKRHREAVAQCWEVYRSLCSTVLAKNVLAAQPQSAPSGNGRERKVKSSEMVEDLQLPPPQLGQESSSLPMLVTGVAMDLIFCAAEDVSSSASMLRALSSVPEQLDPWLGVLPPASAEKQKDILFKRLYKLASLLAEEPRTYEAEIVHRLCVVALHRCANSSQYGQYVKVARRLCFSLSVHSPKVAVSVCKASLSEIAQSEQLTPLCKSSEMLDLIDCFARLCQMANCTLEASEEIGRLVDKPRKNASNLVAVAGLYVVGLQFSEDEHNQEKYVHRSPVCQLLENAAEAVHDLVGQELTDLQRTTSEFSGSESDESGRHSSICRSPQTMLSVFRALDYVRKASTKFVQSTWEVYVSSSCSASESNLKSSMLYILLGRILDLFCACATKSMSHMGFNDAEIEVISKGQKSVSAAALAALRLSIVAGRETERHIVVLNGHLKTSTDQEELRWLMSSTYNMGVQIFNAAKYELSCDPLRLAYAAACARMKVGPVNNPGALESTSGKISNIVSDVIAKSVALVDALIRSGNRNAAVDILLDGLYHWGRFHAVTGNLQSPCALVRLWVKTLCAATTEETPCLLFDALSKIQPPLSSGTFGLLIQEELLAYDALKDELSTKRKGQLLDLLLNKVYISGLDYYERSRALVEKARTARFGGTESLSKSMAYLSESVTILEHALQIEQTDQRADKVKNVLHQLAITLCVRGLCGCEVDPSSKHFVKDFSKSLKCWREVKQLLHEPSSRQIPIEELPANTLPSEVIGQQAVTLLLDVADLAALRGYSELQGDIYDLILEFAAARGDSSAEELFTLLWAKRQLGHVLCHVPHSPRFSALLSRRFGMKADCFEAWETYANNSSSSLLDARLRLVARDLLGKGSSASQNITDWAVRADAVKLGASAPSCKGLRTAHELLDVAAVYHCVSQQALESGDLVKAVADSREALQLRFKCFTGTFQPSNKQPSETVERIDSGSLADVVGKQLDVSGHVAACAWPAMYSRESLDPVPSQWRVLGDYLESLFQVGVVQERSGVVDEAEKNLLEGLRIANAFHLPIARGMFTSALGEILRKKKLWKLAVDHFTKAHDIYSEDDIDLSCKSCIKAGRGLLRVRVGDLIRHCGDENVLSTSAGGLIASLGRNMATSLNRLDQALQAYGSVNEEVQYFLGSCNGGSGRMYSYPPDRTVVDKDQLGNGVQEVAMNVVEMPLRSTTRSAIDSPQNVDSQDILCSKMQQVSLDTGREGSEGMQLQQGPSPGQTSVTLKRSARIKQKLLASAAKTSAVMGSDSVNTARPGTISSKVRPQRRPRTRGAVEAEVGTKTKASKKVGSREGMVTSTVESRRLQQTDFDIPASCPALDEYGNTEGQRMMSHNLASTSDNIEEWCSSHRHREFLDTSSMHSWVALKWEQCGRRLLARALTQKGKTYSKLGLYDSAEQSFRDSWALLQCTGPKNVIQSFESTDFSQTSLFPLDEAWLLYHFCKLRLQRDLSHEGSRIHQTTLQQLLKLLYRSFLFCHQVPPLLQKVANLLALLHVPTSSGGVCQHPGKCCPDLHTLAAYFHQAALGAPARQQHLAVVNSKLAALGAHLDEGQDSSGRKECLKDMQLALRIVPHELNGVMDCKESLLQGLRGSTVCCISAVDKEHAFLLNQKDDFSTVWLFITHIGSQAEPVVIIVPAITLTKEVCSPYSIDDEGCRKGEEGIQNERFLDSVIPEFASIMAESRISTAGTGPVTTIEQKSAWWKWRINLDFRLASLLSALEDHWLGPWKCFLLGRPSDSAVALALEKSAKKLCKKLQSIVQRNEEEKLSTEVDEKLVSLLLQSLSSLRRDQLEAGIAWILGWKRARRNDSGCSSVRSDKLSPRRQQVVSAVAEEFVAAYKVSTELNSDHSVASGTRVKATRTRRQAKRTEQEESSTACFSKEGISGYQLLQNQPVQLVLDGNLQVLPWESLPCVRQCEMYRMPSVGSIRALVLHQNYAGSLAGSGVGTDKRSVNATDAFYLLNPSGDLSSTQAAFEDWFAHQEGWKGKAGEVPSVGEFMEGLLEHDLFIYFGHGSGEQYFSERRVRKLDNCAAALLMGCGSGRLAARGDYDPVGVPLSYLMAGCPTAIGNLWDVTDGDIDRFSRVLLHRWLGGSIIHEEERDGHATRSGDQATLLSRSGTPSLHMGSVSEGRDACKLPFLIGAAPVCYGVPTPISARRP